MKKTMVYLVGAGPGAEDLITLRGLDCIRRADCIIYDRLISERLLEEAPSGCEKLYVGKTAGEHSASQEEINALLLEKAEKGGSIVRLKGGDPYVFGRGGEEALCLYENKIPFQVVPGVSSAIAGPCFAGIPVTHRGLARSVHIITAHTKSGELSDEDFKRLAPLEGTLVFLMGLSQTAEIAAGLMRSGMDGTMPAAVVSRAGTPEQTTVISTLESLSEAVQKTGVVSPAIIIVGATVTLGDKLNFLEKLQLWNKKILVTSDKKRNGSLSQILEANGADVTSVPMTEIVPVKGRLTTYFPLLSSYSYLVFTSGNTVDLFMEELFEAGADVRKLGNAKICAVGPST
ncbi:MAG: uroporphyrinogen-III C-methyltransferase, partial [Oscillospiraceae bacterium]